MERIQFANGSRRIMVDLDTGKALFQNSPGSEWKKIQGLGEQVKNRDFLAGFIDGLQQYGYIEEPTSTTYLNGYGQGLQADEKEA